MSNYDKNQPKKINLWYNLYTGEIIMNEVDYRDKEVEEYINNKLGEYRRVLLPSIYEYLESLVNLEVSAVKELLSKEDYIAISNLDIYRKVVIYNIYNKILRVIQNIDDTFIKRDIKNYGNLEASLILDGHKYNLVDFKNNDFKKENILLDAERYTFSTLKLYNHQEKATIKDTEIEKYEEKLNRLYNASNPFFISGNSRGELASSWIETYNQKLQYCIDILEALEEKAKSSAINSNLEKINDINELLFKELELVESEFKDSGYERNTSVLTKRLEKRVSGVDILKCVQYK